MKIQRFLALAPSVGLFLLVSATQDSLPKLLEGHRKLLLEAQSMSGSVSVQPLPGTLRTVKFKFSKPNLFKIESDDSSVFCDGKDIYSYSKGDNSYTVEPFAEALMKNKVSAMDTWAWRDFFNAEAYRGSTSKLGKERTMKGETVTEVTAAWDKPEVGNATLFFRPDGYLKGANIRIKDAEAVVLVESIQLEDKPLDSSEFTFAIPSGAKKVEVNEAPKPTFASVQAILNKSCMPCHNSQNQKDGIDLGSYEAIIGNSRSVVAGEPDHSGIYTTTGGPRPSMPKDRPRLTKAQTQAIFDWIKAGAKND
ncbi:MAG: hypothetical protein JNM34_00315 [Chthonomonadaceae bacterium]|nr:hypothetical protein [Chthonomonadaceae bacterium]